MPKSPKVVQKCNKSMRTDQIWNPMMVHLINQQIVRIIKKETYQVMLLWWTIVETQLTNFRWFATPPRQHILIGLPQLPRSPLCVTPLKQQISIGPPQLTRSPFFPTQLLQISNTVWLLWIYQTKCCFGEIGRFLDTTRPYPPSPSNPPTQNGIFCLCF